MGTKRRIIDEIKFDVGLQPQSLASTSGTGRYFPMAEWRKVVGHLLAGAMVAGASAKIELFQAKDKAGGSAALAAGATATIVANTAVHKCTITLATFVAAGTITINGLVFTAHATVTTVALRQFSISGADTADAVELVTCINDPTYGVPGVFASSAAGVVTLIATDNKTTVTIASSPGDATDVKATLEAEAIVELDVAGMSVQTGFTFIAAKVTTAAGTVICGAGLARLGRFNPIQQAAALASV